MLKEIALIKRKPGLSPEEFRKQFEEVHAPLELSLFPTIRKYVRNYITANVITADAADPDFDCIAEHWFDNREDFQAMVDASTGDANRALGHSGKVFLDTTKTVYFLVEEVESQIA